MALVELARRIALHAIDHAPALDRGTRRDFLRPAIDVLVARPVEEFAGAVEHEGGSAAADVSGHEHGSAVSTGLALYKLIKPVGILTLLSLVTTVLVGVFRRKSPKLLFKWHKRMAITTLVLALVHVVLIVIAH